MKSLASPILLLVAVASPIAAQEPPAGDGPRGTSQGVGGETRYDAVGYAGVGTLSGVSAASAALPAGSFAEVTALDSGRTIVVAITDASTAPGRVLMLSPDAAATLALTGERSPVRVRRVTPTPQDVAQLRSGQAAASRADAPPALLVALRKKLSPEPPAAAITAPAAPHPAPAKVAPPPREKPREQPKLAPPPPRAVAATPAVPPRASAPTTAMFTVQVAALSSAARAAIVAKATGGEIVPGPPVWRVRMGPYPDIAAANRAKADAARKGYPGGQITRLPLTRKP